MTLYVGATAPEYIALTVSGGGWDYSTVTNAALLLSRVEEHAFTLESAKLHASLPRLELLLRGWSPAE